MCISCYRFEEEVLAMARELEDKDREYEDCVIRVSEIVELVKVRE